VSEADASKIIITARRDGAVKGVELAVRIPDKEDAVLNVSIRRTIYGSRDAYLLWFYDMTDQKRLQVEIERALAEQKSAAGELRESQQLLSGVIQNSKTVIFVKRQGRYIMVNKAWEELTGISAAEARNKTDLEVFDEANARRIMENDARVIAARAPSEY